MTVGDWARDTRRHYQELPMATATKLAVGSFYQGAALRALNWLPIRGTPVYEHDWDVMLVLDACRVDALEEVSGEYDWLPRTIPKTKSVGSMSEEWLERNFVSGGYRQQTQKTAHVTWNAFSNHTLDPKEWHTLEEVWRHTWDEELGLIPPRAVTDEAIRVWREIDVPKMLVHYMQPHTPYRSLAEKGVIETLTHDQVGNRNNGRKTVWDLLRSGEISHEEAWDAYLDNLRWALDDIELLLQNMDAERVLLTADHGDCFGELGFYGHPKNMPIDCLTEVPLVELKATDEQTYEPEENASESIGVDVEN